MTDEMLALALSNAAKTVPTTGEQSIDPAKTVAAARTAAGCACQG